jgi:hypothetical protein
MKMEIFTQFFKIFLKLNDREERQETRDVMLVMKLLPTLTTQHPTQNVTLHEFLQ